MPRIHEKADTFSDIPESDLRFPSLGAGTEGVLPNRSQLSTEGQAFEEELDAKWTDYSGEKIDTRHPVDRELARIAVKEVSQTEQIDVRFDNNVAA